MKNIFYLLSISFATFVIGTESNGSKYGEKVAITMPCCSETMGHTTCKEFALKRPKIFQNRCKTDADFGMIQCCKTCKTDVVELGRELFEGGIKSKHCFDRQNKKFCMQFLEQSEMWGGNGNKMSCNGEAGALAFRICRRTCGFCDLELYDEENYQKNCPKINNTRLSFMEPLPTPTVIYGRQRK